MAYTWAERAGRYRDERTGRFVSESRVRLVVDKVADATSARLDASARSVLDGTKSIGAFQADAMREIRLSHVAAVTLAHGGASEMTPARYLEAARGIKAEYAFMRGFVADIASGAQKLDGSLVARARQYGQSSRVAYEKARGQGDRARGMQAERNVLHPAEHCQECLSLTARGWVPIGSLPPIGSRRCRSNDRCSIQRRRGAADSEVAA